MVGRLVPKGPTPKDAPPPVPGGACRTVLTSATQLQKQADGKAT